MRFELEKTNFLLFVEMTCLRMCFLRYWDHVPIKLMKSGDWFL
jgi:hypothetical protein